MEARLDCEFGKDSDHEGSWTVYWYCCYGHPLDDEVDNSDDLFCVACNKLFRTAKA